MSGLNLGSLKPGSGAPRPAGSFLPEDYVRDRRERRSNILAGLGFGVVMFLVVSAFFVTQRQWTSVKSQQESINRDYATEAQKIDQLKSLEKQKVEMLDKAEITAALLERVPRSVLLAELINRMPDQLTLTDFKLDGKRVVAPPKVDPKDAKAKAGGRPAPAGDKKAAPVDKKVEDEKPKATPPKFEYKVELVGLAANDQEVADYQASLKDCPLLVNVDLISSIETVIDDVGRRKFRIEALLRTDVDARNIQPLQIPRGLGAARHPGDPMAPGWTKHAGFVGDRPRKPGDQASADDSLDPTRPRGEEK
jgi:Tfp pilus assembly protein PilN